MSFTIQDGDTIIETPVIGECFIAAKIQLIDIRVLRFERLVGFVKCLLNSSPDT